jgi:small-conductance mechanosensitive channel
MVIITGFYSINIIRASLAWLITISLSNPNSGEEDKTDEAFLQMLQILIGILTYVFVFLMVGQILNWNLSFIMGGLGVTSIAIAFAIQNILADIFAAFTIFIDQPFRPGDQIILENYTGTVKKIGLKSTRISLLDGDELIVSNQDLTSSRVRNLRKIKARRVLVNLILHPKSTTEHIKITCNLIKTVIQSLDNTELKRIDFLRLTRMGKEIEYVYLIADEKYEVYCDIQQKINFAITQGLEQNGIDLAFEI